jgi:hypothetical protein
VLRQIGHVTLAVWLQVFCHSSIHPEWNLCAHDNQVSASENSRRHIEHVDSSTGIDSFRSSLPPPSPNATTSWSGSWREDIVLSWCRWLIPISEPSIISNHTSLSGARNVVLASSTVAMDNCCSCCNWRISSSTISCWPLLAAVKVLHLVPHVRRQRRLRGYFPTLLRFAHRILDM